MHWKRIVEVFNTKTFHDHDTGQETTMQVPDMPQVQYLQEYNKEVGEKLVDDANNRCSRPSFYFIEGNTKYSIRPEDFNGDFDAITRACRKREYIF
jgi:hypothetical protein